ncbi:hypothetical protein E2562_004939 [Oryza meyeriana var. granulata]|uniref:Uncharacterized protein n=1 Tax=Oryza meyeriana var. granulata TaxID=110450 RepID=A0A6G1C5W6_9ORYZ|nr:hypothetical protein E2562_004939 [Oryza meyeriana var. granulata]
MGLHTSDLNLTVDHAVHTLLLLQLTLPSARSSRSNPPIKLSSPPTPGIKQKSNPRHAFPFQTHPERIKNRVGDAIIADKRTPLNQEEVDLERGVMGMVKEFGGGSGVADDNPPHDGEGSPS